MPTESIDFGNNLESGHEVLAGASPQSMNVVVDGKGAVLRRPGISAYSAAPTTSINSNGIDGLMSTLDGLLYAVSKGDGDRVLYRIKGGTAAEYGDNFLSGKERPIFAETESITTIALGGPPYKIRKDDLSLSLLGGDPPDCTHMIATASRLECNDSLVDRTKVNYSNTAGGSDFSGYEDWTVGTPGGPGFFTAEARPDPVVALAESTSDIFIFGSSNLELYAPDASLDFARTNVREYGCSAPYSVIKDDAAFAWLDHRRRFVFSDGRNFDDKMGQAIQSVIDGFTTVSDCFGYRVHMDQIDCFVWTFPTEGMTFSYQKQAGWSQWQGWDSAISNWQQHRVLSHHHRPDTDVNVVGLIDGRVAKYDMTANDDLGELIPASVTTGFLDRGTDHRKQCKALHIAISRGTSTTSGDDPIGFLSYADAPGQWRDRIPLHLGIAGDTNPVITLRSLGWYRRRQWKFEFSSAERLALVSVKEDFTVLEP